MAYFLSPVGNSQIVNASGAPVNGGKLFTYLAGTSTPAATYTSNTGLIPQANPIILNSLGWPANPVWMLGGVSLKYVITDAFNVILATIDNIIGINDVTSANTDEWIASGLTPTYVAATIFSVVGDQTLILQVGRRVKTTNTSGFVYSSIVSAAFSAGVTTVTVRNDSLALDTGLSSLFYSFLSSVSPSLPNSAATRIALGIPDGIGKNKLINPNFAVNQRAVTGTVVLTSGAYGHDRFKAGAGGCTYTFATALNVTTITITAGTLQQIIEGLNLFSGTHTLSWVGSATARIDSGAYGASGITGAAVGGTNQTVEWGTGTVSKVQYEAGTFQTTLESRLIAQEIALCQRYFEVLRTHILFTATAASQYGTCRSYFKATKRVTPTTANVTTVSLTNSGGTSQNNHTLDGVTTFLLSTAAGTVEGVNEISASAEI